MLMVLFNVVVNILIKWIMRQLYPILINSNVFVFISRGTNHLPLAATTILLYSNLFSSIEYFAYRVLSWRSTGYYHGDLTGCLNDNTWIDQFDSID